MKTNFNIIGDSHQVYQRNIGLVIGANLIIILITAVTFMIPLIGFIIYLIIGGPLKVGYNTFNLKLSKINKASLEDLFAGFNSLLVSIGLMLIIGLVIFAGAILFIIPGIILGLMFSQAFYILAENPQKGIFECLEKSLEISKGFKWKIFLLHFLFWLIHLANYLIIIGIFYGLDFLLAHNGSLLLIISAGIIIKAIEILYINPLEQLSYANLYHNIKETYLRHN